LCFTGIFGKKITGMGISPKNAASGKSNYKAQTAVNSNKTDSLCFVFLIFREASFLDFCPNRPMLLPRENPARQKRLRD